MSNVYLTGCLFDNRGRSFCSEFQVGSYLFGGRHQEMSDLALLLSSPDTRLITILGAGGMGKTRLALETARVDLNRIPAGVYFAPLALLTAAAHIISAIGERVGLQFNDGVYPLPRCPH